MSHFEGIGRRVLEGMNKNKLDYNSLMEDIKTSRNMSVLMAHNVEVQTLSNLNLLTSYEERKLFNAIIIRSEELK